MVTVHVAVEPVRVATTSAFSTMKFNDETSSRLAVAEHAILSVVASVELTVMVKLKTNFPPNVVVAGVSPSGSAGCGMEWKIPVRGSRYPRIPCTAAASCPQSETLIPSKQAQRHRTIDSL